MLLIFKKLISIPGYDALALKEDDVMKMLSATTHIGTTNCDFQMEHYVYKRRNDGVFIINIRKVICLFVFLIYLQEMILNFIIIVELN